MALLDRLHRFEAPKTDGGAKPSESKKTPGNWFTTIWELQPI